MTDTAPEALAADTVAADTAASDVVIVAVDGPAGSGKSSVSKQVARALGFGYWSLSAYLKHKVKNAVDFISHFEDAVVDEARKRGLDGVICGHIHTAALKDIDGVTYANDGDWVESCTALVEHMDGRLEIIDWMAEQQLSPLETTGTPAASNKAETCVSYSSPTPGFLRSMASYARLLRS